jgi:hypothetical protein
MLTSRERFGSWPAAAFAVLAILTVYFELFSAVEVAAAFPVSRVEHFLLFMVLAGAAGLAFPQAPLSRLALGLAVFGGALELLEMREILDRTFSIMDWVAEVAGSATALGMAAALRGRLASRHYRRLSIEPTSPVLLELLFVVLGLLGLLAVLMQPPG